MSGSLYWSVVDVNTGEQLSTFRGRKDRFSESWEFKYRTSKGHVLELRELPPGKHSVNRQVPRFFNARLWREYIIAAAHALHKHNPRAEITPYDLPSDVIVLAAYVWYHRSNRGRDLWVDSTGMGAWFTRDGHPVDVLPIDSSVMGRMKDSTYNKYYDLLREESIPRWPLIKELIRLGLDSPAIPVS